MLEAYRARIECALEQLGTNLSLAPILLDSMRYGLLNGGKRIRPCLLLCVTDMLGGDTERALPFACALEMIHSYSLIHDDLPAMDNDDFRRGKPSNHKQFGEANAILAGDGLLTAAALLLAEQNGYDTAKRAILTAALDMVSGQSYDLNESERNAETLRLLNLNKTGALFRAATLSGAFLAGRDDLETPFAVLGENIGLLFQMTDDLLDAQKDTSENKFTYLTYYGESRTRRAIQAAKQSALGVLEPFDNAPAKELKELIDRLTSRTE